MAAFSLRRRLPRSSILWFLLAFGCAALAFVLVRDLATRAGGAPVTATVSVVVAARDLQAGWELTAGDVELAEMPMPAGPAALTAVADAIGRVTVTPLVTGEAVTATRLAEAGGPLVTSVPPGLLGVTLGVEALPNGLVPGDRIDVLATFTSARPYTTTVAEDVPVLRVPRGGDGAFDAGASEAQVLIVASPEVARQLVQADATGVLAIAVRGSDPVAVVAASGG
jgi:Flp pilus assembly protein CpaB